MSSRGEGDASSSSSSSSGSPGSLSSLNARLIAHGWAKRPLNLDVLDEKSHNEVVAVYFNLLGSNASNVETLDDLSARHRTLQYENERLLKANANGLAAARRAENEAQAWRTKYCEAEKTLRQEENKVKELREEVSRGRKALEGVRIAASHEIKKVQTRLDAAQAKLAKLGNDATLLTRPQGLCLLNPIASNRTAPIAQGQAPLLEQSLRDLAEARQGLQEESEAFRHVLVSTANELREVLAFAAGQDTPPRMGPAQFFSHSASARLLGQSSRNSRSQAHHAPPSTAHPGIADARMKHLLAEVRVKLSDRIVHVHAGAAPIETPEEAEDRKRAEREEEKQRMDLEDRVKDLEIEVVCARGREEEAKKAMEEFARAQMEASAQYAETNLGLEEQEELWRQKTALADERRQFKEETLRLAQERRKLESERMAFCDERRKVDVDAILNLLPSTPSSVAESGHTASSSSAGGSGSGSSFSGNGTASAPASASASGSFSRSAGSASPSAPEIPESAWMAHIPLSPSPLSPSRSSLAPQGKVRTPRSHTAGKRRTRTPLSRFVLEKAVRQKSRDAIEQAQVQAGISEGSGAGVLGESRSANLVADPRGRAVNTGKGRDVENSGGARMIGADGKKEKEALRISSRPAQLAASVGGGSLARSTNRKAEAGKSDLAGSVGGVGPRTAAKAVKAWR